MEEFLKHEIEDLKELAADPTLESCCRRDLEDQLRVVKAKAQLAPQDRTQTRQRLARAVLRQTEDSDIEQEESDSEELGKLIFYCFCLCDGAIIFFEHVLSLIKPSLELFFKLTLQRL